MLITKTVAYDVVWVFFTICTKLNLIFIVLIWNYSNECHVMRRRLNFGAVDNIFHIEQRLWAIQIMLCRSGQMYGRHYILRNLQNTLMGFNSNLVDDWLFTACIYFCTCQMPIFLIAFLSCTYIYNTTHNALPQ